jgi:hypothetical protein
VYVKNKTVLLFVLLLAVTVAALNSNFAQLNEENNPLGKSVQLSLENYFSFNTPLEDASTLNTLLSTRLPLLLPNGGRFITHIEAPLYLFTNVDDQNSAESTRENYFGTGATSLSFLFSGKNAGGGLYLYIPTFSDQEYQDPSYDHAETIDRDYLDTDLALDVPLFRAGAMWQLYTPLRRNQNAKSTIDFSGTIAMDSETTLFVTSKIGSTINLKNSTAMRLQGYFYLEWWGYSAVDLMMNIEAVVQKHIPLKKSSIIVYGGVGRGRLWGGETYGSIANLPYMLSTGGNLKSGVRYFIPGRRKQ